LFNGLVVYVTWRFEIFHGAARAVLNVVGAVIAAALSYHFIERPFLRLKDKFHRSSLPAAASA
jgi:peptidoglycan/LPS O-acetylase OafA/YrhL